MTTFGFLCLFAATCPCLAQDSIAAIRNDIRKMLIEGEHTFQLMKNKGALPRSGKVISPDEYGQITIPELFREEDHSVPIVDFQPVNTLHLQIRLRDDQLNISPAGSSFCPEILICLSSLEVRINKEKLCLVKKIRVENERNVFNSAWHGYQWQSSSPDGSSTHFQFTLGTLEKGKRIYMDIRWLEGDSGFHYRLLG